MATAVHIPVEEYLRTSYEVDCDYVDGVVEERNVGTPPHATLQFLLAKWFDERFESLGWVGVTEQTVKLTETRYRVPDVCVLVNDDSENTVSSPPLVCAEVLSPEDRMSRVEIRLRDFQQLGVPNVWLFDPVQHLVWTLSEDGTLQPFTDELLPVSGSDQALNLPELFQALEARLKRKRS